MDGETEGRWERAVDGVLGEAKRRLSEREVGWWDWGDGGGVGCVCQKIICDEVVR